MSGLLRGSTRHLRNFCTMKTESLNITDTCVRRLKRLTSDEPDGKSMLRVLVEGGGCSGFQYKFELDTKYNPEEDIVFQKDGVKIVVDKMSFDFIKGATVDYHEELIRSAFRISNNPIAEKGCSCGSSFAVKLD